MTESQQRFLRAIADRVPADSVVELRLFPTVRSGRLECGVAVLAAEPAVAAAQVPADVRPAIPPSELADDESGAGTRPAVPPFLGSEGVVDMGSQPTLDSVELDSLSHSAVRHDRFTIWTARFRHVVKGPERGKWDFDLVHDADAPLDTLEQVARGAARRVGESGEPELLSGDAFQRAVTEPWWSTTV